MTPLVFDDSFIIPLERSSKRGAAGEIALSPVCPVL